MEIHKQGGGIFYTTATTTKPKVEHFRYEWRLENFSKFYQPVVETFIALCRGDNHYKWVVKLYPKHCQTVGTKQDHSGKFVLINVERQHDSETTKKDNDGYRAKIALLNGASCRLKAETRCLSSKSAFGLIVSREAVLQEIRNSDKLIVRIDLEVVVKTQSICSFVSKVPTPVQRKNVEDVAKSDQQRISADELDFCLIPPTKTNDRSEHGNLSEAESEDDWVVADVVEALTAPAEAVLKQFDDYCTSKHGKNSEVGTEREQQVPLVEEKPKSTEMDVNRSETTT